MKTRHLAFICLGLSAVVAVAANDAASGSKRRDDPPSPVEVLAHIPRLQYVNSILVSPDGTILAIAGDNQTVNLWGTADDKWRGSFGPSVPPESGRCVMQFVRDGLMLAGVNWFQRVEVKLWSYPGN